MTQNNIKTPGFDQINCEEMRAPGRLVHHRKQIIIIGDIVWTAKTDGK